MKFKLLLSFILFASVGHAQMSRTIVDHFNLAGPYKVSAPYKVDTVNAQGATLSDDILMASDFPLSLSVKGNSWTGCILPSLPTSKSVNLLSFYIDPQSYLKVKLLVKGPKSCNTYVDGKLQSGDFLNLSPYRHEVVIRCLSEASAHDSINVIIESKQKVQTVTTHQRLYTTYDCLDGLRIRNASLSSDGRFMIVSYVATEKGGKSHSFVRVKRCSDGRVIDEKNQSAGLSWMPVTVAYLYEENSGGHRMLYKVDPVTNNRSLLASDLPEGSITMSPSEDYLILTDIEEGTKERPEIYQILEPEDRQPGWRNRMYFIKYDLKTGISQRLTFGSHSTYLNDISADGKYLLFSISHSRLTKRPTTVTSFLRMNMSTLQVDTIFRDAEFVNSASFSPDGRKLLVSGSGESFGGIGLKIAANQISSSVDGQLFIYDLSSRVVTPLTKDFNPSVNRAYWSIYDNQIYFDAADRDYVGLYTLQPSTKKIHSLGAVEDVVSDYTYAVRAPMMIYIGQSVSNSVRMYTYNLKKKQSVCVEDCSKAILKNVVLGKCHDWNFVSSRGDTIYGRYYLPPYFDATKKYPLIVNYYGGCSPTERTMESRYPAHAYAAQGYIVYVVQPSGATGFGQEFSARHVNTWGEGTADDIIEGTKKFCASHDFVNAKKIGCIGASYGGFMTQYLQTVTDIFAAAISHAGISDITSYWGEGYWGYSYSEVASAGKYPWNARDMYTKQSPLFNADKIHTPLLFLHGSADTNVPIGESIQMFTALKLLGRETAFVEVAGQDHHILDYNKRLLWQDTIFAWFSKWLKDDANWWNNLYPAKNL